MEQAIERLRAIPEGMQDPVAAFLLHELAEDERWAKITGENAGGLKRLVDQILDDDRNGKCEPLDPERL